MGCWIICSAVCSPPLSPVKRPRLQPPFISHSILRSAPTREVRRGEDVDGHSRRWRQTYVRETELADTL